MINLTKVLRIIIYVRVQAQNSLGKIKDKAEF